MKAIKTILILFVIFTFIQCNKDAKVEPIVRILPNGTYQLSYQSKGGQGWLLYKVLDNNIYGYLQRRDICMSKVAGELKLNGDSVKISTLHIQKPTNNENCVYYNEIYGGDTSIFRLQNIEIYKDNNLRNALRGRYFITYKIPDSGSFILTYTPTQ